MKPKNFATLLSRACPKKLSTLLNYTVVGWTDIALNFINNSNSCQQAWNLPEQSPLPSLSTYDQVPLSCLHNGRLVRKWLTIRKRASLFGCVRKKFDNSGHLAYK